MKTYQVTSHKGGVGNTTVACAIALRLANQGINTLLIDNASGDVAGWLGMPDPIHDHEVKQASTPNLSFVRTGSVSRLSIPQGEWQAVVVDEPRGQVSEMESDLDVVRVSVARNDYLCLKHMVKADKADVVFCITEPDRPLTLRDAQSVLGTRVIGVEWSVALCRAIDAGLATSRSHLSEWADEILDSAIPSK